MMDARGAPTAASSARLSALSLRLPSHDFGVLDRAYIQLACLPRYAGTRRRHGTNQRQNACGESIEMLIPLTTAQCRCLVSAGLTSACLINPPCCSVLLAFALHDFHKNCSPLCAHESNTNLVGSVARVQLGRWAARLERLDGRCSGVGQRLHRPRPESRVWAVGVRTDESRLLPVPEVAGMCSAARPERETRVTSRRAHRRPRTIGCLVSRSRLFGAAQRARFPVCVCHGRTGPTASSAPAAARAVHPARPIRAGVRTQNRICLNGRSQSSAE